MGCATSVYAAVGTKKKLTVPEVAVFVPSTRIPAQSDLQKRLKGLIPKHVADRLSSVRNQIVFVAVDTGGSAIPELRRGLEEYLSLLIGLTNKEYGLEGLVEFKWTSLDDGKQQQEASSCVANSWFEVLSVVHLMAMLALAEADTLMIPKDHSGSGIRTLSSDCKREAVDLLLKATGYLEFCVRDVLVRIPPEIKKNLPKDLQDGVLEAISFQTLGQDIYISYWGDYVGDIYSALQIDTDIDEHLSQGTEIQLGLAVDCQKATLSVKRRLACEQLSYFSQAYHCLSGCDRINNGYGKKHMWFIKWKFLESKAAAYYFHGLMVDKGNEPSCHVSAVCCFLAAEEILSESKKACFTFCLAAPVTRAAPLWGAMKHLHQKIPEVSARKSQMYGYLLEQEKVVQVLPDLPEFQLSLRPDDYQLPEIDPAWESEKWETQGQSLLKEQLNDSDDDDETETE